MSTLNVSRNLVLVSIQWSYRGASWGYLDLGQEQGRDCCYGGAARLSVELL